jgi:hypothetical protein
LGLSLLKLKAAHDAWEIRRVTYPLNKGLTARQAHVALPENTFEEEHGREGFYGPVSHLYRPFIVIN